MKLISSSSLFLLLLLLILSAMGYFWWNGEGVVEEPLPLTARVELRTFGVELHSVGELEAARSHAIASSIRGERGKVIELVRDGMNVQKGELLVKMDPTPFEERIGELRCKLQEQKSHLDSLIEALKWEQDQVALEEQVALLDCQAAELELAKVRQGDGPLELSRLHHAMVKAQEKWQELLTYSQALEALGGEGYLNASELRQVAKKLEEEQDNYDSCKLQYETFRDQVHPMQLKKAESSLQRLQLRCEEAVKAGRYKVEKAASAVRQAEELLRELHSQQQQAEQELIASEIRAPAPGMVVLREDYRAGQKRKPRVGDILVKNQPILELPDLASMIVKTRVREVDLHQVALGKEAIIAVDAYPELLLQGKVEQIGVLALTDLSRGNEKYFEVKLSVIGGQGKLRPGMTARVTILCEPCCERLSLPVHALFMEGQQVYSYRVEADGHYAKVAVALGAVSQQWAEVLSGLDEGEEVCLSRPPLARTRPSAALLSPSLVSTISTRNSGD